MSLVFSTTDKVSPGALSRLLRDSYAELQKDDDLDWQKFVEGFDSFDAEIFSNPRVARCTFLTVLDDEVIGLGSFDPRKKPEYGDIGHNCILPAYSGRGYGKMQIEEICRRLKEKGIQKARVSTGEHPFFASARKMYKRCGFRETRHFQSETYPHWMMVEYEKEL